MKICLQVNGREECFSEEELKTKLERLAELETLFANQGIAKTPTEGKVFPVNPMGINQVLFSEKRSGEQQEWTRQTILEAFAEVKNNPERYARPFKTMIPKKTWIGGKKVRELQELANDLGGHMANWVEQALEWAQRIANGETWEIVCDDIEILSNHSRIIIWKDGFARSVGGECDCYPLSSASQVDFYNSYSLDKMCADVPNVVLYD